MTDIRYPEAFDGDDNLHVVRNSLRLRLAADYTPGDTSILVEGDAQVLSRWPDQGMLTLTEQYTEIDQRAISFTYDGVDIPNSRIENLVLLPGFPDVEKAKIVTNVTMNVMAYDHNILKDALISIETFAGVEGTVDDQPLGETLEGRVNFLRNLVLAPKAWFSANARVGIVPFEVEFQDLSFRLGTDGTSGPVLITWDFGDNSTSNVSVVSATIEAPNEDNIVVYDSDGGKIRKTYLNAGLYNVKLTVQNDFGTDICEFPEFINARIRAPDEAVIIFVEGEGQTVTEGDPEDGPYEVFPRVRSPINSLIQLEIPSGENPNTPGFSYAGEQLNGLDSPLDPITTYTWSLGDDIDHPNADNTRAVYGVGGIYDLKLRVDTQFGAFRITTYEDAIDIVENYNLWTWIFQDTSEARAYEYGLISETFKLNSNSLLTIERDDSFLDDVPESTHQKREFRKNTGAAPRGTLNSGKGGTVLLYWASGRAESDAVSLEQINFVEYSGFTDTYITRSPIFRPWNWASFHSTASAFFAFGSPTTTQAPSTSPTNPVKTTMDLISFTASNETLTTQEFANSGEELLRNPAVFEDDGTPTYGHFSVYRTAWKDNTGYIARNDGVGPFFRIRSFYRTEGSIGDPFQTIRKMTDVQGPTKVEGELTDLSAGIYFFNNSGSISSFSPESATWKSGGPGINSVAYRALQDTTISGFDSQANTLLLASDKDHRAYISFDYSENVFLKFNEIDLTFISLGSRPEGEQWLTCIY